MDKNSAIGAFCAAVLYSRHLVVTLLWQAALQLPSAWRGQPLFGAQTLLERLADREDCPLAAPPSQFFRDLAGDAAARERAIVAALPRPAGGLPPGPPAYGRRFDPLMLIQARSVGALLCRGKTRTLAGLVALRRFVDQVLDHPTSLRDARRRQCRLLLGMSPLHNRALIAAHGPYAEARVCRYFELAKLVGRLLEDPRYADRLFAVPAGRLGLRRPWYRTFRPRVRLVDLAVVAAGTAGAALCAVGLLRLSTGGAALP